MIEPVDPRRGTNLISAMLLEASGADSDRLPSKRVRVPEVVSIGMEDLPEPTSFEIWAVQNNVD